MALRVAHSAAEWKALAQGSPSGGDSGRAVISVGNFDGLHIGHQRILRAVVERARREEAIAAVITFDPHPMKVLRPETAPLLLMTMAQRLGGFEQMGLDAVLVMQFDDKLARLSADDFVRLVLVETVHAKAVLVGTNFRFGHKQTGNVDLLERIGKRDGFAVEIVHPAAVGGKAVSSTTIRRAVAEGNVEEAAALLGRPFALTGPVRAGEGRGSKTLFPTLNLAAVQEILPGNGVYATETVLEGKVHRSVTNVGTRPTFDGIGITVESHLFDYSGQVSPGALEVRFWKRLRAERKFDGPDALRAQIEMDIKSAKDYFQKRESPTVVKSLK
jgi:riboflavin kinase/FMN adenylyltransferase